MKVHIISTQQILDGSLCSVDEGHIQDLVEASSALNSKREVLSGSFLIHVVDSWKDLYSLISESLHAKHGLAETTTAKKTNFVPVCYSHVCCIIQ